MATQPSTKLPVELLTAEEIQRLLAACSQRAPTGVRNRALLTVLWRGGLRCSEAVSLYPRDVDATAGLLRVRHGKGDQARTVVVDRGAVDVLLRWMDRRQRLGLTGRHRLFSTLQGRPLDTSYVRHLMRRLGDRTGLEGRRCHPHQLRHCMAAEMALEGVPIVHVQAQLGHASLQTTAAYLRGIAPAERIERLRARQWPEGKS
jgi:site-specific recombinase XerD